MTAAAAHPWSAVIYFLQLRILMVFEYIQLTSSFCQVVQPPPRYVTTAHTSRVILLENVHVINSWIIIRPHRSTTYVDADNCY